MRKKWLSVPRWMATLCALELISLISLGSSLIAEDFRETTWIFSLTSTWKFKTLLLRKTRLSCNRPQERTLKDLQHVYTVSTKVQSATGRETALSLLVLFNDRANLLGCGVRLMGL